MTVEQIEGQLARARTALERAAGESERADASADRHTISDPGALSGIRRKPNARADNARWNSYSRAAEKQRNLDSLRNTVRVLELRLAATIAERDRVRFTPDDFVGAELVRDANGWHRVVRINKTSVSVETGYSWTDLIKHEKVLQIHRPDEEPLSNRSEP